MSKKPYMERLRISLEGNDVFKFFSRSGELIAEGYSRVVIGGRGPYVEFEKNHLLANSLHMPQDQKWRIQHPHAFYLEYRSNADNVKIYFQKKIVEYADYQLSKFYISPFDLFSEGISVIE